MSHFVYQQVGNKRALVTLAIGQKYRDLFDEYAKDNFLAYCKRFDYDLICITEPLDQSDRAQRRSAAWQKLLILSQPWSKNYTQILWLDTDIIINLNNAKDIAENVPIDKISAVNQYAIPTKELYQIAFQRYYLNHYGEIPTDNNLSPSSYYKNHNLSGGAVLTDVVQTGVWLASPQHHRELLEKIYYEYEDVNHGSAREQYEMPAMSFELLTNQQIHWIQYQFNFDVIRHLMTYYPHIMFEMAKYSSPEEGLDDQRERIENLEQELIKNLNALYQLSIFMHFNGCHQIMIDYAMYIKK